MVDDKPATPVAELSPYFLGSIVLNKEENSPDSKVVDGQQRLVALTLLLSALRETIKDHAVAEDLTPFLYAKGNKVLGTRDRYRLLVQGGDRDFFQTNFVEPGGMTQAAKRILPRGEGGSQENLWATGLLFYERMTCAHRGDPQRLASFY